jgi:hypothetical protein
MLRERVSQSPVNDFGKKEEVLANEKASLPFAPPP